MTEDTQAQETQGDEDDFTHYFNATARLSRENADLRARLAEATQQAEAAERELARVSALWNAARMGKPEETRQWARAVQGAKDERDVVIAALRTELEALRALLSDARGYIAKRENTLEIRQRIMAALTAGAQEEQA